MTDPASPLAAADQRSASAVRNSPEERKVSPSSYEQNISTEHLRVGLRGQTVSSSIITTGSQLAQLALTLGSVVVLARLLDPQEFGLVAMVTAITGFLRIFSDAGLSTATVQKVGITHAQVSNLFWTNITLGALITGAVALSAPLVAWFYREPRLIAVTLALSSSFLVTSSTVQHQALLQRQMRFATLAFIQVGASAFGVSVGIAMAWLGYGYWCLVWMQLSQLAVTFLLTWWLSPWRPQRPTGQSGTRSLLTFGASLTASSFLWALARGSDALLIGRFYGPVALGHYTRASALLDRPLQQAMSPLQAVFVPTFSRVQTEPERYRRIVLQVFDIIAIGSFPFSALLLALAQPLTLVVLGPKWEDTAPIFAAFTLVALYMPLSSVASWMLASQGRGNDFLLLSAVASAFTVASFLAGLPYGPVGVATANSLSCVFVNLPLGFYIAGRRGPVSTGDLSARFFQHLPIWGAVGGTVYLLRASVQTSSPLLQLAICVPAGLMVGAAFVWASPPARRAALSLIDLLSEWKRSRTPILAGQ
jgi:PST family polysaccharide transporter